MAARRHVARSLALSALLAVIGSACVGPDLAGRPPPQRTVEVTLVDVFSGSTGATGRSLRNGLELEASAINARGGLLGSRVEIVAADGEMNPAKAAELVRQQVGDASTGLVVGPDSTASFLAAREALDHAGMPNCVVQMADRALGGARSTFRVGPPNSAEVGVLLDAVRRTRPDVHGIALLDEGDELGRSYDEQLAAQAGGIGLAYVGRVAAGADADRAALQQLTAQGAQVVVVALRPAGAARVAQTALQLGGSRPLLAGFGVLAEYGFPSSGGDAAVGAVLATTPQTYLTGLPQAQWPRGYRAFVGAAGRLYGFGGEDSQLQATPAGADCLRQWARAVTTAGTFAGAAVTSAWERLDLPADQTALGVHERLTSGQHSAVAKDGLFAYTWAREGSRYRLKPVPTD